jgi:hypothetical protein
MFVHLGRGAYLSTHMDQKEQYLRLALKAQSQCRATIETLAVLKNPPVFTRQANIAGQQVVNNGTMVGASRAREIESAPKELLEVMANGWTQERRARQAKAIRRWRPWKHSTGPRTAEGKARSSRNAWKGGQREMARALARFLRRLGDAVGPARFPRGAR